MRIGIFTDVYPPYINGVSTSVAMLEKSLKKLGHQVLIVTVNTEKFSYKNESNIIRIPGVPTGFYDYRLTNAYPLKAISKIKKWNLDVIHSHTEFGVGSFARIFAKQFDIPLVHTYHTMYEDYIYYITKGFFDKSSKKILAYLTDFYCNQTATELIVPTKKTHDLFKKKYKFTKNVHIIPTGIEIERFYPENNNKKEVNEIKKSLNIEEDDFVILSVGRLAKEKSTDFLIEAQAKILKTHKAKLLIVGDGPDSDRFKSLASKLNIESNVIFTGKVSWDSIPLYYQIANVFATASTTETQGLTVIEAMASAIPVVAIDDESFNTVIENGSNGYLFKNKNQYMDYVKELIDNKDRVKQFGEKAKIDSEPYSSVYFGKKVLEVYDVAIQKNKEKIKKITTLSTFKKIMRVMFKKKDINKSISEDKFKEKL